MYHLLAKTQLNRLQHIQNALAHAVIAATRSSSPGLKFRNALITKLYQSQLSSSSVLFHITVVKV